MRRMKLSMPSPAMLVAILALVVATGGTATAAVVITGKQIKNSSISGKDVKNKSLTPTDFRGTVRGAEGPQGAQGALGPQGPRGDTGAAGSAAAYGSVSAAGALSDSKGINSVTLNGGIFCIDAAVPVNNIVGTMDFDNAFVEAQLIVDTGTAGGCPAGTDAFAVPYRDGVGSTPQAFMFLIN
jgi:hypothetical protein